MEDSVGVDPGKAAMGFQRGVLHPLRRERAFIGDRGLRQRSRDIAEFTVDFGHDIAARVRDAVFGCLVAVQHGCIGCDRADRIDHRRQDFILNP